MQQFENILQGRSSITPTQSHRLRELIADWQLLSDLSFADLVLWVPLRKDSKSWPTGHVAIAHIRPTTAATVFTQDVIGEEAEWGSRPGIERALSDAEIVRDAEPELIGELMIKEETIPVIFEEQVIAVISRHRNADLMRSPSRLELNYREIAHNLYRMIAEGNFPTPPGVVRISSPKNLFEYAKTLYQSFEKADSLKVKRLCIYLPDSESGIAEAIKDRVLKAASR